MKKSSILILCLTAIFIVGCKSTPPTKKDVGQTNFQYKPTSQAPKNSKIIAIVSPEFKSASVQDNSQRDSSNLMRLINAQNTNVDYANFNREMSNRHSRLRSSMANTFNEIIISKGFNILGPYDTFDDITYTDKKTTYLALVPNLEVYIDQKPISRECNSSKNYCEDVGTVQVSGSLNFKLIEPMTKQTFMSKRINLAQLTAQRDYEKRWYVEGPSQGLIGMAISAAVDAAVDATTDSEPKPFIDNTDKVLADALNEFYAKAMAKVDTFISAEELLSYEKDVTSVKNLKRF